MGKTENPVGVNVATRKVGSGGRPHLSAADLAQRPGIKAAITVLEAHQPVAGEPLMALYQPVSDPDDIPESAPMIIGICGDPKSGKDVVADYLSAHYRDVERLAFSDSIIPEVNGYLEQIGSPHRITPENKSEPMYRTLLQEWGLERAKDDPAYWTSRTLEAAGRKRASGQRVIITGLRLPQDLDAVRSIGGQIWRVERPGNDYRAEHAVESQLAEAEVDRVVLNDVEGDLKPFEGHIEEVLLGTPIGAGQSA